MSTHERPDDDANPVAPDMVRRVERIAEDALQRHGHGSPAAAELEAALGQVRADRTNGEPLDLSFARLCEAVAAVRAADQH